LQLLAFHHRPVQQQPEHGMDRFENVADTGRLDAKLIP